MTTSQGPTVTIEQIATDRIIVSLNGVIGPGDCTTVAARIERIRSTGFPQLAIDVRNATFTDDAGQLLLATLQGDAPTNNALTIISNNL